MLLLLLQYLFALCSGQGNGYYVNTGTQYCGTGNANCITTGSGYYGNNEYCEVTFTTYAQLSTGFFSTESCCDKVTVGGRDYKGSTGPNNVYVNPGDKLVWDSDGSISGSGWSICVYPTTSPTAGDGGYGSGGGSGSQNNQDPAVVVLSGSQYCHVDEDDCVESGDPWEDSGSFDYGDNEDCTIRFTRAGYVHAKEFSTEITHDTISLNGMTFDGDNGPDNEWVNGYTEMRWTTDSSISEDGWKICWSEDEFSDGLNVMTIVGILAGIAFCLFVACICFTKNQENKGADGGAEAEVEIQAQGEKKWEKREDANGRAYYVDVNNNVTVWEKPDDFNEYGTERGEGMLETGKTASGPFFETEACPDIKPTFSESHIDGLEEPVGDYRQGTDYQRNEGTPKPDADIGPPPGAPPAYDAPGYDVPAGDGPPGYYDAPPGYNDGAVAAV